MLTPTEHLSILVCSSRLATETSRNQKAKTEPKPQSKLPSFNMQQYQRQKHNKDYAIPEVTPSVKLPSEIA
jgi:hypothetical protein